jgi:NAD(P)-dependent dehydrogenase (short-subunit alcohol dehydrogenase family)
MAHRRRRAIAAKEAPVQISLQGRNALITGGSKGLGLAMAKAFAAAGAGVAIAARDAATLEAAAAAVREAAPGAKVAMIAADVATIEGCVAAFQGAQEGVGPVDILVNNAGVARAAPFASISDADWQADLDLKLMAHVRLCRLALPAMRERRWGRIVNVLATAAKAPGANSAPSSVSRAAGMALTKALASEVAPDGVLVNALLTGLVDSDQWRRRFPDAKALDAWRAQTGKIVPVGRVGEAEEFANLALFLASDAASYVTGTAINVDGGLSPVV